MPVDLRKLASAAVRIVTSHRRSRCGRAQAGPAPAGRGREIVVVESGGLDFDAATQALADGPNLGDSLLPAGSSWLRFFGGTTNVWGGRCARLEAIDFTQRDGVPLSGWPFTLDEIERWYAAAAADVELGPDAADPDGWRGDDGERGAPQVRTRMVSRWRLMVNCKPLFQLSLRAVADCGLPSIRVRSFLCRWFNFALGRRVQVRVRQ